MPEAIDVLEPDVDVADPIVDVVRQGFLDFVTGLYLDYTVDDQGRKTYNRIHPDGKLKKGTVAPWAYRSDLTKAQKEQLEGILTQNSATYFSGLGDMTTTAIVTTGNAEKSIEPIVNLVLDAVQSDRTRREYRRALTDFLVWYRASGYQGLIKATVQAHIAALRNQGVTDSSINQRLSALRLFAVEAADNLLIEESVAQAIKRVPNIRRQGKKLGNWLTKSQAETMINAPDTDTLKSLRDRAILAVMIGCGLRREEVVRLDVAHLQQREGRWVILDLKGKHNRTRTIPMSSWVKAIVDRWLVASGISDGALFPSIRRGGHIQAQRMSSQAVWQVVQAYSPIEDLAPHDLRRTFAKLAHKAGAPIEQVQRSLGHASVQTTEHYLAVDLDLATAPSDLIKLDV
jgi:site-specific recombinase XerD